MTDHADPGATPHQHESSPQHEPSTRHEPDPDGASSTAPTSPSRAALRSPRNAATHAVGEVALVVVLAMVLSLLIKTFLVQAFFIPSASMETTLLTGDRVLVSKLTPSHFALHRGDIVVFKDPGGWLDPQLPVDDGPLRSGLRSALTFVGLLPQDSGEHLIKRVIGLPGDVVACCDSQGWVTVNGASVVEPYLYPGDVPSQTKFAVTVPPGKLWVMGDHRSDSKDSRAQTAHQGGFVPVDDVVGKAFVVVWPLDRFGGLAVPDSVFAKVPNPPSTP